MELLQLINTWLSPIGNITSIIGFVITILVWFAVDNLKTYYIAKATIPNQLSNLEKLRQDILDQLNGQFDNNSKEKILELIGESSIQIKNLAPKLKKLNRQQYKEQIEQLIKNFNSSHSKFLLKAEKDTARELHRNLLGLSTAIKLLMDDDSWRRTQ